MKRPVAVLLSLLLLLASILPALGVQAQGGDGENDLESYLNGLQPTGIYQPNNPWLNPGFEVTTGVDVPAVALNMVAPPTYFRSTLDEANPDHPDATPHSKQAIALGEGTTGNALRITWDPLDNPRSVSLGQALGQPGQPYGYTGASTLEFDFRTTVSTSFVVTLYYAPSLNATSSFVRDASIPAVAPTGDAWTRVVADVPVPEDQFLTHAIIRIEAPEAGEMLFDNVLVSGSTFTPIDTRSDATDGYAVFVRGKFNTASALGTFRTVGTVEGDVYLVSAKVRNFTTNTPRWVDVSTAPDQGLHLVPAENVTGGFHTDSAYELAPRAVSTDGTEALYVIPKDLGLAVSGSGPAALYGHVQMAEGQAVFGHYNPVKSALHANAFSDLMDPMPHPVRFTNETTGEIVRAPMGVAILETTDPDHFTVRISAPATGWREETTLSVTGFPDQVVVLDGSGKDVDLLYSGSGENLTATTTGTLFLEGAEYVAQDPVAHIQITPNPVLSLTDAVFDASGSQEFQGAELTSFVWEFGEANAGAEGAVVTHAYATPGTYQVTLTVTDAKGRSNTAYATVTVENRAPSLALSTSGVADRLSDLYVGLDAGDLDGTVESITVQVDGVTVTTVGDVRGVFVDTGNLTPGTHTVSAYAVDDQGDASPVQSATFEVINRKPTAFVFADKSLVAGGETVTFSLRTGDADGAVQSAVLDFGDGNTLPSPAANVSHSYAQAGLYFAYLNATDNEGAVQSAFALVAVDTDTPTSTASFSREASGGWFDGPVDVLLDVMDPGLALATAFHRETVAGDEPFLEYAGPIPVSGEGEHVLQFYAEDEVGHREATQSVTVRIDETRPDLDASGIPADGDVVGGTVLLRGKASDGLSGVTETRLLLDGVLVASASGEQVTHEWDTRMDLFASHEVTLEAVDAAGNVASSTVTVYVLNHPDASGLEPRAGAEAEGGADNDGDAGFPQTGRLRAGFLVSLDGLVLHPETLAIGDSTNATLALAGLLVDTVAGDGGGRAGVGGQVFAFGTACAVYAWSGDSETPLYNSRVTCGLA